MLDSMVLTNISNMSEDIYHDYTTYKEYQVGVFIWQIVPPFLIVLGTVGNCISIVILTRSSIRSATISLYLAVLSFTDLVVLYSGLLRQWLIYLFDTDVRHVSEIGCKLNIWLVYSSLDFSAWILVGVTIERMVSAWCPHRAQTLCNKKRAIGFMVVIGSLILLLNSHLLYGMVFKHTHKDEIGQEDGQKCVEIDKNYYKFFNDTWPWIDLCAFCAFPLTIIAIGNCLILLKLMSSRRKLQSRQVRASNMGDSSGPTSSGQCSKLSSTTTMLFTLNIVFLVSTLPISIYNIGYSQWTVTASAHDYAKLDLWWAIVNMFMYINNSINFLLYCLSGVKFRKEAVRICCRWRQNQVHVINVIQNPDRL